MAQLAEKTISTPAGDAPLIPVLIMAGGAYLCWFGVHYWRSDTAWPSDPVKALLTGKPLPTPDYSSYQAAAEGVTSGAKGSSTQAAGGGTSAGTGGSGTPSKGTLTYHEITTLWVKNGGNSQTANLAAAIAEAESSGNVTGPPSPNPDGGTNVGLWQLDTKGVGAGYTVEQLKDPDTNARITIMATGNGTKWGPWETWHTGAYKKYLQQGPVASGSGG